MSLRAFITTESAIRLNYYYEEYVIKKFELDRLEQAQAMVEYCGSGEYNLHLTYLIETWVTNMETQFYLSMKDGKKMDWFYHLDTNEFNLLTNLLSGSKIMMVLLSILTGVMKTDIAFRSLTMNGFMIYLSAIF